MTSVSWKTRQNLPNPEGVGVVYGIVNEERGSLEKSDWLLKKIKFKNKSYFVGIENKSNFERRLKMTRQHADQGESHLHRVESESQAYFFEGALKTLKMR